jgi:NADH-quinone oxidoreductase subunit J
MTIFVFILFSILTLGGGVLVVTQRNLVRAAAALVLSLFGVAGLYVLLEAGFLAAVQVLIYIGAIAILIIFAVMLTRGLRSRGDESGFNSQWTGALGAAVVTLVLIIFIINSAWPLGLEAGDVPVPPDDSTRVLGVALLDPEQFMLPFEIASVLLLGALVGAIVIARDTGRRKATSSEELDTSE